MINSSLKLKVHSENVHLIYILTHVLFSHVLQTYLESYSQYVWHAWFKFSVKEFSDSLNSFLRSADTPEARCEGDANPRTNTNQLWALTCLIRVYILYESESTWF